MQLCCGMNMLCLHSTSVHANTLYYSCTHILVLYIVSFITKTVVFGNTDSVLLLSRNALLLTDAGVVPLDDLSRRHQPAAQQMQ